MKTFLAVLAALVIVPAASAAYPTPFAAQGVDAGLYNLDHSLRFVALKGATGTKVQSVGVRSGAAVASTTLAGDWGIPMLTYNGLAGGLFRARGRRFGRPVRRHARRAAAAGPAGRRAAPRDFAQLTAYFPA